MGSGLSKNDTASQNPKPCLNLTDGITCSNLQFQYHHQVAIENLNGAFAPATMTAIIGPNGGGKSTLLQIISGQLAPTSGSLSLGTFSLKDISYLPQSTTIDRSFPLKVYDVVAMGLCPEFGFFKKFDEHSHARIMNALDVVGLQDCANRPLHALSGGQFQRVLFARMSLQNAKVILLDEPFAAIDAPTMELLAGLLKDWQAEGKTIIAVLHDMDIVREFFPRTLVLARRPIAWGETEDALIAQSLKQAKELSKTWDIDCEEEVA